MAQSKRRKLALKPAHLKWLMQLTALPTASGREGRVIRWVTAWARQRRWVHLTTDEHGNLMLRDRAATVTQRPLVFEAHMDHPAFVVAEVLSATTLIAEFRGGVADSYFKGSKVWLHAAGGAQRGTVRGLIPPPPNTTAEDKRTIVGFTTPVRAKVGDVLTWALRPPYVSGGRLRAPACDDLAGVAAGLAALDELHHSRAVGTGPAPDVRLLLTRAEEVGFIGAIAACQNGSLPRGARVVNLENSRSFAESPLGGGPIVRVGDRTSTFDPDLTYRLGRIAELLARDDPSFQWQRKLMPGGTCEASAYQSFGYTASCLCLPLGNYHNMNDATGRIDSEVIELRDQANLIRLLVAVSQSIDDPDRVPALRRRLEDLFARRRSLLDERAEGG